MGCGASKAAEIDESSITIKQSSVEETIAKKTEEDERAKVSSNDIQLPGQSVLVETEVHHVHSQQDQNIIANPKPIAYDIPFNDSSGTSRKVSYPQRLEKIPNQPLPTKEELDDKLRAANQRKDEELRKRKESRRASKIRREIIEAREFEISQQSSDRIESTISGDNVKSKGKISLSENIEVDMTYNAEDNDSDTWT